MSENLVLYVYNVILFCLSTTGFRGCLLRSEEAILIRENYVACAAFLNKNPTDLPEVQSILFITK